MVKPRKSQNIRQKSAGNAFQAAIEDAEFGKEPK